MTPPLSSGAHSQIYGYAGPYSTSYNSRQSVGVLMTLSYYRQPSDTTDFQPLKHYSFYHSSFVYQPLMLDTSPDVLIYAHQLLMLVASPDVLIYATVFETWQSLILLSQKQHRPLVSEGTLFWRDKPLAFVTRILDFLTVGEGCANKDLLPTLSTALFLAPRCGEITVV